MRKNDIAILGDIELLVDTFYARVQLDSLIGPIFNSVLDGRWDEHLKKMYTFWQTILLGDHTYFGSPFPPHAMLSLTKGHFDVWVGLWRDTVNEFFEGDRAKEAVWRGEKMAEIFLIKITYMNEAKSV